MTQDNEVQPGVRINESLWKEFREDIRQRRGGVRGHLRTELENAIRSYLEASKGGDINDRLRRIENHMEELGEGMDTLVEDSERKKNKDSGVSTTVKNRLEAIQDEIEREAGDADKVHESVINNAIEKHAGTSRPTLDRYKEMLEQRHVAHEWPEGESSTWWLDTETFVNVLSANFPHKTAEYSERYGGEWWDEQLDGDEEQPSKGFQ